jgi:hypothetical protein
MLHLFRLPKLAIKAGRCHKFRAFWQGPFVVVKRLSDLNYKIVDKKGKEFVVHINRLKKSYDPTPWKFETARQPRQRTRKLETDTLDEDLEMPSRPITTVAEPETRIDGAQSAEDERPQLELSPQSLRNVGTPVEGRNRRRMPNYSAQDPDCEPPNSPRSRRELATTPIAPPVTRSHARLQLQENSPE